MNVTRNGKIARLPKTIRDELNRRLSEGERGTDLVAWLNSLPEVQGIIAEQFGGKPMRAQNLSEWKQGGYQDWLNKQHAMEMVRQLPAGTNAFKGPDGEPFSDILATWLTAHYGMVAHKLASNGELDWKRLRKICHDVSVLRRGDHNAQHLKLEREKLEHARKQTEDDMVAQFVRWARDPKIQELLRRQGISAEEQGGEATDGADFTDRRKVGQWVSESVSEKPCARRVAPDFQVQRLAQTPVSSSRLEVQSHPDLCAFAPWRESSDCGGHMSTRMTRPSNVTDDLTSDSSNKLHEGETPRVSPFLSAPLNDSPFTHLTSSNCPIRLNPTFEIFMAPMLTPEMRAKDATRRKHCYENTKPAEFRLLFPSFASVQPRELPNEPILFYEASSTTATASVAAGAALTLNAREDLWLLTQGAESREFAHGIATGTDGFCDAVKFLDESAQ